MGTAHFVGHAHPYRGHARALKHHGRVARAPRLIAPHDLNLFSDRLDDARERESTVRDFAVLRDLALSADDYSN